MTLPSFDLTGKTAVVTGGYGILGGMIASGLAAAGAHVIVLGRRAEAAKAKAAEVGGTAIVADVLDEQSLRGAAKQIDRVDILVNAAGGNVARSRNDDRSIFDVPLDAFDEVLALNLRGTVAPSMIFGETMAKRGAGVILNISSMAAMQALSGVLGYSVAKAGIDNFTRWMAVDLARKHGEGIRVNAIAPGFFLSEQNRAVLVGADGQPTARAKKIVDRTPMGRFGRPDELLGAVQWLCSDAASFVTGVVIPVDGGFSAFSGV